MYPKLYYVLIQDMEDITLAVCNDLQDRDQNYGNTDALFPLYSQHVGLRTVQFQATLLNAELY